ncbi:ABC transporter permease [Halobacterium sp. KA-4]|uniref:ABC transporter permease n=1 Tax=Halobacterium sp. KA-4 TaxID=2896367 RepID=UPI001E4084C3|nr:ABC transporter permease [Halobacterium sp. KA-4]MCD2201386.1 ABC transporter permease [Halobacterium sp. KA-4]
MSEAHFSGTVPDRLVSLFFYTVIALTVLFVLLPILVIVLYSFVGSLSGNLLNSFTTKYYREVFSSGLDPLILSFQLAIATTVIDILLGVPAAYTLDRYDFALSDRLREVSILPMAIPGLVLGIALVRTWGVPKFGVDISGTIYLLLIAHVIFTVPFMIQTTTSALQSIDYRTLEETAQSLGASWPQRFLFVVVPNVYNGILSGAILTFALSMGEFNITLFVYNPTDKTLPIEMFGGFTTSAVGQASALSAVFVAIIVISLWLIQYVSNQGMINVGNV